MRRTKSKRLELVPKLSKLRKELEELAGYELFHSTHQTNRLHKLLERNNAGGTTLSYIE